MRKKTISGRSAEAERRAAFEGEVPKLGRDFFEGAQLRVENRVLRPADGTYTQRGRPPAGDRPKVQQSLRLSAEVIEHFRAGGPGWQRRIDEVLKRHVREAGAGSGVAEGRPEYRGRKDGESAS